MSESNSDKRKQAAEQHRATSANFSRIVDGVTDWDAPTPVSGWVARDIVRHLVEWSRGLLGQTEGLSFGEIPSIDADPAAAWHKHDEQMQMVLDAPAIDDLELDNDHFGKQLVTTIVSQYYTPDVFMHSWDLAVSSGQASGLDQATCAAMLEGMEKQETSLRAGGMFGERQSVADDASSEQKLIAFIGRDPYWTPPAASAQA